MSVRLFLLASIGACLATAAGCGGGPAPEPPKVPNVPGSESSASRQFMKPEYQGAFDKDGKLRFKPGMKPPAGAAPRP